MILLALSLAIQRSPGLPAWAYTYELPAAPAVSPGAFGEGGRGGNPPPAGRPASTPSGGAVGTGKPATPPAPRPGTTGTGTPAAPPAAAAPAPVRLGDLIPDFKGPSLALGGRLEDDLVGRAIRRLDDFGNVLFTVDEGGTMEQGGMRTSYLLDGRNEIQFGTSFVYVSDEESKARFEASRALLERRYGAPVSGFRTGIATLTLNWDSPEGTARLDLDTDGGARPWIRTTIARAGGPDRYYPPVARVTDGG